MNRGLLFKGIRVGNNGWVVGDLTQTAEGTCFISRIGSKDDEYIDRYEVIPQTLCQYTNIIDKEGKGVWEHDVVLGTSAIAYEIVWNNVTASFCMKKLDEFFPLNLKIVDGAPRITELNLGTRFNFTHASLENFGLL